MTALTVATATLREVYRMCRFVSLRSGQALLVALTSISAQAAVFTVGSPVGPGQCSHATVQAAIDAAAESPGLDIIRLTRGVYAAQRLVVNDSGDLAIEGGFLDCTTLVRVDHSTLDGQGANPPGPVIRHTGTGHLALADLHVRNGMAFGPGSTTTFGGGLSSTSTGSLTVYRSQLVGNRARSGGGMYVQAPFAPAGTAIAGLPDKLVTLVGVGFANNQAEWSGGGLYAARVILTITGDEVSYFAGNRADGATVDRGGGAIYVLDSSVSMDPRPPAASGFMEGNWTEGNGGAIFFETLNPGSRSLQVSRRPGGSPPVISANTAGIFGGAIFMRATASGGTNTPWGRLTDAVVTGNRAAYGGAFYLYANGVGNQNRVELNLRAGNPGCAQALRCNRVEANVGELGAVIETEEAGSQGNAEFTIDRGHLLGNIALSGSGLVWGHGDVRIDNSVVAGNDAGNSPLIEIGAGTDVEIENSTIAANIRTTPSVFRLMAETAHLNLHNSILFQPGSPAAHGVSGSVIDVYNLLADDTQDFSNEALRNIQYTGNPLFVNPGQGDFRPQAGSPAVNRWAPGMTVVPTVDLLGATRPAAPPGAPTPYDFGAYEYGAVVDRIFLDGFNF
jgi:hypothetical protein